MYIYILEVEYHTLGPFYFKQSRHNGKTQSKLFSSFLYFKMPSCHHILDELDLYALSGTGRIQTDISKRVGLCFAVMMGLFQSNWP